MPLSKDYSKQNFTVENPDWNTIKIGALQRIADATELMASNYLRLQRDADNYKKWWQEETIRRQARDRRISALRGVITKLKAKGA